MTVRKRIEQRRFVSSAEEAVACVLVAADHLNQSLDQILARHGITADQYNLLRILRGVYPAGHPRYEVERRMLRRSPDVTRMLDRLVRRGLVARKRDEADHRLSVAAITRSGLKLLKETDPEMLAAQGAAVAVLTPNQRRQLARLCDLLVP